MSKRRLTMFLCDGKDCAKSWGRVCRNLSAGRWLKQLVKAAGLPYKLDIIKTECMDLCDEAACLCVVADGVAAWEHRIRSEDDADRLLATLRSSAEKAQDADPSPIIPSESSRASYPD